MELKYHKFKLKNGLRIFMVPRKETKAVFVEVIFGAGSRYENKENNGIAHFLEHMAFKGTKRRPTSLDITKEIDGVGGSFNAYTGQDLTGYWIRLQAEKAELAFDILSDMLLNSKFQAKELKKEKGVILEEIKMYNDDPGSYAGIMFQELIYGDTPLGRSILGTVENIKTTDRKRMLAFRSNLYAPNNMVVAIGGNISQAKARRLSEKYFGKLKGNIDASFEKNNIAQQQPLVKIFKKDIEQSNLIVGFRSFGRGHKDRYTRGILSKILGGYMSSKLFTEVREKKGLAYTIRSWVDTYAETGCLGISGGFDPRKQPHAIEAIFKVLREVKNKGFKSDEIKMAKENSVGKLILNLEGAGGWAEDIAVDELYGLPIETPEEIIAKTKKVTNSDIKRLARQIFRPENLNIVTVGPIDPKEEKKYRKLIKL